jgi:hemoglobin
MRNLKTILCCLFLLTAFSLNAVAQNKSLYDRLGGKEAITAVVDDFAGRVLADARINQKFGKSDPARLKAQLVDQICFAAGGPCQYTGRDMKTTHTNMGVTEGEFNALVEDLVATLNKFNVADAEQKELLGLLGPMKSDIVEVNSAETGTALPKKFKAYKASKSGKVKSKKKTKDETMKDEKVKDEKVKDEKKSKTKKEKTEKK